VRALTFGAYLTGQWLPGKKLRLATTTTGQDDGTPGEPPGEDRLNPVDAPDRREGPSPLTWAFIRQLVAGEGFEPSTFGL
jgi:hypothetical protein